MKARHRTARITREGAAAVCRPGVSLSGRSRGCSVTAARVIITRAAAPHGNAANPHHHHPADASSAGHDPARGIVPAPPRIIVARAGDAAFDAEILRYAEGRTRNALDRFAAVRVVEIVLGGRLTGEASCRLRLTIANRPTICVGHTSHAILHAIDVAVETAAHIIAGQVEERD